MNAAKNKWTVVEWVFWTTALILPVGVIAKSSAVREFTTVVAVCVMVAAISLTIWRWAACRAGSVMRRG